MLQADNIIALHGSGVSLVIECPRDEAPLWRYWGPKIADQFFSGPGLRSTRPTPSFSLDHNLYFSVFPCFGLGWFGASGLLAHRAGLDFAQGFQTSSVQQDGNALTIVLSDTVSKIDVIVSLALDPLSDVLTLSSSITNQGDEPLHVQWLAGACLPLPPHAHTVHAFSGRHNAEFTPVHDVLGRGIWLRENRHGLTSHDTFPGATVEADGACYGAQLAWSGNSVQQIEWLDDGRYQWQLGTWLSPGEAALAPGETLTSPDVLATCSTQGADGVAANFHTAIRQRMTWPTAEMKPRPVHLNTWEGFYFDHDEARLKALADASAAVGIERFVLDDGWFHKRDSDMTSLGDWWVDACKYPQGLAPLAQHVTGLGMEFGLWIEPEMVNPDSDLFRAHPEWVLQIAGRPHQTARNQLMLDLSQPGVCDYLFEHIGKLLSELPISYLKWDHNRDMVPAGGADGQAMYRRQVLAAYALLDRFRAVFPEVEIEACAGGGGRIDAGIVQHTHRFWTSDNTDALSRLSIQNGFLQFMPPELMGAHVAASPNHSTGREFTLDFRAAVAMQGHFGVELDVTIIAEAERERLAEWIAFYKTWRRLICSTIWRGKAGDSLQWHAAGNTKEWLLFIYRTESETYRHTPPVRLPFASIDGDYLITSIGPEGSGEAVRYSGSWLSQAGLPVQPAKALTAQIFHGKLA